MLLSVNADAKTKKGVKLGYLTGIVYMAPHTLSGYQVCPKSTEGCRAACLFTAGHGIYKTVQRARIARTKLFFENRSKFMYDLSVEIAALIRTAYRNGLMPAVRLNGTSDIAYEKIIAVRGGKVYRNLMQAFPEVQFYDYTAIPNRNVKNIPNYHITFSMKENNERAAMDALKSGMNVAVVFSTRRSKPLPETWRGYKVIDGDESDTRFLNATGVIIGLRAKGKARYDASGFVKNPDA